MQTRATPEPLFIAPQKGEVKDTSLIIYTPKLPPRFPLVNKKPFPAGAEKGCKNWF
jgi:hypothetical protein